MIHSGKTEIKKILIENEARMVQSMHIYRLTDMIVEWVDKKVYIYRFNSISVGLIFDKFLWGGASDDHL